MRTNAFTILFLLALLSTSCQHVPVGSSEDAVSAAQGNQPVQEQSGSATQAMSPDTVSTNLLQRQLDSLTLDSRFVKLFDIIRASYNQLDRERLNLPPCTQNGRFDFARWSWDSTRGYATIRVLAPKARESFQYLRIPNGFGLEDSFEVIGQDGKSIQLWWLSKINTSPIGDRRVVIKSSMAHAKDFPSFPLCFVRIKEKNRLLCISGVNWDGAVFESPFTSISQIINVFELKGDLTAVKRLHCGGSAIFMAGYYEYDDGQEVLESVLKVPALKGETSLGKIRLSDMLDRFDQARATKVKVTPILGSTEMPIWFFNNGLYETEPSVTPAPKKTQ